MRGLSGYLLASTLGADVERSMLLCEEPLRPEGPTLHFVAQPYQLPQWDELKLTSPIPLDEEPIEAGPGPFRYSVYVVRGFSKVILLAQRKRVVDYVLTQVFDRLVAPRLRRVALHLDPAIRFCGQPTSPYLITSLLGRFAGPARQLRAIALYGDEVTDSPLFRDYGHLFNVYSCGLGKRLKDGVPILNASHEGEIVRIGNDGSVLAHLGSRTKSREFMKIVAFLVQNGWIEDWVPIDETRGSRLG